MKEVLTAADVRAMICCIADAVIAAKPFLTEVDSAIGDGDHGIGMAGGLQKAKDKVLSMEESDAWRYFDAAGKAMLMSMGGASGVIFGSLFMAGAKGQSAAETLDAAALAQMMRRSLDAIKARGKAEPGDKTMVDALQPAVEAMESTAAQGLCPMLAAAAAAAREGMERTKEYQAKFGRAKSLMERAIGHQDAGATSVWIIFEAMRDFAAA